MELNVKFLNRKTEIVFSCKLSSIIFIYLQLQKKLFFNSVIVCETLSSLLARWFHNRGTKLQRVCSVSEMLYHSSRFVSEESVGSSLKEIPHKQQHFNIFFAPVILQSSRLQKVFYPVLRHCLRRVAVPLLSPAKGELMTDFPVTVLWSGLQRQWEKYFSVTKLLGHFLRWVIFFYPTSGLSLSPIQLQS